MVGTAERLEEELRQKLIELERVVEEARKREVAQQEIDQRIDQFEIAWEERLAQEREAAVRGAHLAITEQAAAEERASRIENNLKDAQAFEPLDDETRWKMWNSTNRSNEPRLQDEPAAREHRRALFDAVEALINEHTDKLQDGLREATDAIRNREELSLQSILEAQRLREAAAQQERLEQEMRLGMKMGQ